MKRILCFILIFTLIFPFKDTVSADSYPSFESLERFEASFEYVITNTNGVINLWLCRTVSSTYNKGSISKQTDGAYGLNFTYVYKYILANNQWEYVSWSYGITNLYSLFLLEPETTTVKETGDILVIYTSTPIIANNGIMVYDACPIGSTPSESPTPTEIPQTGGDDDDTGFFEGILGGISDIWKTLTSLVAGIINGVQQLLEPVLNLLTVMWNFLSSLIGKLIEAWTQMLKDIFDTTLTALKNLPDFLHDLFDDMVEAVKNIPSLLSFLVDNVKNLGLNSINGFANIFKYIFLPEDEGINNTIGNVKSKFTGKFGINESVINLGYNEKDVEEAKLETTYNLNGRKIEVRLDMGPLNQGITYFRPIIRGFIVLMMVIYNLNQVLSLIGSAPITLGMWKDLHSGQRGNDD